MTICRLTDGRMHAVNYPYDVTGSIVAYKTNPDELGRVIRCFKETSLRVQIVIVDNSPMQDLKALCDALGAEYIHTGKNLGFGAAHNIALKAVQRSKYHVVLNPDIHFDDSVLIALFEFLEENPSVGLVMPRIVYPNGSFQHLCKKLPTPFDIFARRLFPRRLKNYFSKRMADFELQNLDMNSVLSVPYLSGCFMFFRMRAVAEVGYFDERFFMYFEDTDFTRRIRERYDTVFYPWSTVIHEHQRGSYKSLRLFFCALQSSVLYFNKWGWIWDEKRDLANASTGPTKYVPVITRVDG